MVFTVLWVDCTQGWLSHRGSNAVAVRCLSRQHHAVLPELEVQDSSPTWISVEAGCWLGLSWGCRRVCLYWLLIEIQVSHSMMLGSQRKHPMTEHSKNPRRKRQGFLWFSLGRLRIPFHHIILAKQVTWTSPDSKERKLDSFSWWESGEVTLQKSK